MCRDAACTVGGLAVSEQAAVFGGGQEVAAHAGAEYQRLRLEHTIRHADAWLPIVLVRGERRRGCPFCSGEQQAAADIEPGAVDRDWRRQNRNRDSADRNVSTGGRSMSQRSPRFKVSRLDTCQSSWKNTAG